jgi:hypothetical protein
MRVVPIDDHMHSRWQEGKTQDGRQITSLHTEWHVTNITPHSIRVLDARLIRPRLKRGVDVKHVAVRGLETGEIGQFPIPSGHTTELLASWTLFRPVWPWRRGRPMKIVAEVVDQFGNGHRCRMDLRPVPKARPKPKVEPST